MIWLLPTPPPSVCLTSDWERQIIFSGWNTVAGDENTRKLTGTAESGINRKAFITVTSCERPLKFPGASFFIKWQLWKQLPIAPKNPQNPPRRLLHKSKSRRAFIASYTFPSSSDTVFFFANVTFGFISWRQSLRNINAVHQTNIYLIGEDDSLITVSYIFPDLSHPSC